VLALLAPQLTGAERQAALDEALAAVQSIDDSGSRAWMLAALVPQLGGAEKQAALDDALVAARSIEDAGSRACALAELAPQLTGTEKQAALDESLADVRRAEVSRDYTAARNHRRREQALAALAPQLTGAQLREALAEAWATDDIEARAWLLATFAQQLGGTEKQAALDEGLASARVVLDEAARSWLLGELAQQLIGAQLDEVLAEVRALEDSEYRAGALLASPPGEDQGTRVRELRRCLLSTSHAKILRAVYDGNVSPLTSRVLDRWVVGRKTLGTLARYIIEIRQRWHWVYP
jgi:hypothetical protein